MVDGVVLPDRGYLLVRSMMKTMSAGISLTLLLG